MPWLADLVESSEGSFGILPVECLCEFLLSSQASGDHVEGEDAAIRQTKMRKRKQLLAHLQVG